MEEQYTFLDERAMSELARSTLAELRKKGLSPEELDRLEATLREGAVGEAFIVSSLLKTILNEISPDASQKKLLQTYQDLEHCCYSLVELSRNISDLEVWRHYRSCGYQTFDSFCVEVLRASPERIRCLTSLREHGLPRPGKASIAVLLSWLFDAVDIMRGGQVRGKPVRKHLEWW